MYARWAYLWPCMGRVINNVCSILVTAPAVAIISSQNVLTAVGVVLVLFVGIAISLLGQFGQDGEREATHGGLAFATDDLGVSRAPDQADTVPLEPPELSFDDRLDGFVAAFGLTKRERDVLEALVVSDDSVRTLRRHSSSRAPHSTATLPRSTKRSVPIRAWRSLASSGPGHPKTSQPPQRGQAPLWWFCPWAVYCGGSPCYSSSPWRAM